MQKSLSCPSFLYISLETQNGHTSVVLRWCFSEYPVKVTSSIKPPVGRSSDGCFSTKLTWSLLQVLCWQKHFLILYVTDSQILQLSDNFQVLWPSVAPGSLLFSYFIWVVGIKLISVKRLKYLVRFLVARYIASVSHALVACKLKVRPQPALFLQLLSKKPTWQFLFINRTEKALFRCVNVFFKQTIVLKLFVPLEIQIWSPC